MHTASRYLAVSSLLMAMALSATARTRPHYGATLRVEGRTAATESAVVRQAVAENLTVLDAAGIAQPELAVRWESQNGDRRWQFWVRPNVMFHDGTPMTSAVVAEALAPVALKALPLRAVRALNDSVVFEADAPIPALPSILAQPKFDIARTTTEGTLVGTGPFKVQRVLPNAIGLDAVDEHWGGRAYVNSVEVVGLRPVREQWMNIGLGRADVVDVPAEALRRAQQDHMRVLTDTGAELVALVVNANSYQLQDSVLREAVSASIDRGALANFVFQKQAEPASTLVPNELTGYRVLFPVAQNLARARELRGQRQQALSLTLVYDNDDPALQLAAERVVLNARDGGLNIQAMPRNAQTQGRADLFIRRIPVTSPDAATALTDFSSTLFGEDLPVGTSIEAIYQREHDLLATYRVIPLLHLPKAYAGSERLRDWKLTSSGVPELVELWIDERKPEERR